jgi:hypothetical protein
MLISLYSASYYIRLHHHINDAGTKKGSDTDKYMNLFYKSLFFNNNSQFIRTIGGILSNAIWSTQTVLLFAKLIR